MTEKNVMNPCGKKTKHTSRIGCCARCHELFSSDSAFEKHYRIAGCLDPAAIGLVPRPSTTAPGEYIWHLPGTRQTRLRSLGNVTQGNHTDPTPSVALALAPK